MTYLFRVYLYADCEKTPGPYVCVLPRSRQPLSGDLSANDLRDGQRIVGNKNNRKRKGCVRVYGLPCELPVHNFTGRAEGLVREVNKVDEAAGQKCLRTV